MLATPEKGGRDRPELVEGLRPTHGAVTGWLTSSFCLRLITFVGNGTEPTKLNRVIRLSDARLDTLQFWLGSYLNGGVQ
jgi:hypothetical protein